MPRARESSPQTRRQKFHVVGAPKSQPLLAGLDCGPPLTVDHKRFVAGSREQGWGSQLEPFLARNDSALKSLGVTHRITAGREGVQLELQPGLRVGAIPLRSGVTGRVAGGLVVRPRFGWPGVGRVLRQTGWGSTPEFLDLPLVPGSGREVPPWVLAGPVIQRLAALLSNLSNGYTERCETRTSPRGRILWGPYLSQQITRGNWHKLPCSFSEFGSDRRLREAIRWTLQRVHKDLLVAGVDDQVGLGLVLQLNKLLDLLNDVVPRRPDKTEFELNRRTNLGTEAVREGLRAMGWVVNERGLGGGRTSDGLAWSLPLERLWERYVEEVVRNDAATTGGHLRVGRLAETIVPLPWNDSSHRALGHLVPDFVVRRFDELEIVDAKYKSHFADLDADQWYHLEESVRESMRADIHQVLAYAAACGSAEKVRASLVYPVRRELYERLVELGRDVSTAHIPVGSRTVSVSIKALPFGV